MIDILNQYQKKYQEVCDDISKIDDMLIVVGTDNSFRKEADQLRKSKNNLLYYKNNLRLAIKWIELGHEPGVINGIDNRFRAYGLNK